MSGPCGLVLCDKPSGPTSHDAVAVVRRALGERRVGHAGTLDPFATGLLVMGVGRATRLLRFLADTEKRYEGVLELGVATDTLDRTGTVTRSAAMDDVGPQDVAAAASALTGDLLQVPPMVSAVHHQGRRLHTLAREGVVVERAPRPVRVEHFETSPLGGPRYGFSVRCGSGTYVRVLVDDLGRALGGAAHVVELRRTGVGAFDVAEACPLDDADRLRSSVRPPRALVEHLGVVQVGDAAARALVAGQRVGVDGAAATGSVAVVGPSGELVGVARSDGTTLRPEVMLGHGGGSPDG